MEKNQAVIQELTTILERKGISRDELDGMLAMVHHVNIALALPATACGPFVTMFNDLFGTFVFFTIAHAMSFTVH